MFDLETAIRKWRRSFRGSEAFDEGSLEELEAHLRDKIECLTGLGRPVQEAFAEAVEKIGRRELLRDDFFQAAARRDSGRPPWAKTRFGSGLIPNYLLTAFRKIRRQKLFSFINVAGLAVGLACCAVIILYVANELSYDRFHPAAGRIYRIATRGANSVGEYAWATTPGPLGPVIQREYPQAETVARIIPPRENADNVLAVNGDKRFFEKRVWFADGEAFRVFRIAFLEGTAEKALSDPHTLVLTESTARKYFGAEPALGKSLRLEIDYDTGTTELEEYRVTGIVRNAPLNTHFKYDILLSLPTLLRHLPDYDTNAGDHHFNYTYVRLSASADASAFESLLQRKAAEDAQAVAQRLGRAPGRQEFFLQPLTSLHMKSRLQFEMDPPGNWTYIAIYSLVALLILLIGCLNFVNLSAALSATRTREVGLRKVIGARRGQLVRQFLGESFLVTFLAFGLSLILMAALLLPFNRMAGTALTLAGLIRPIVFFPLLLLLVCVAIGSGAYPAFLLTAFRPAAVLQGTLDPSARGAWVQKILVVGQFAISIFLVICSLTVFRQLDFMRGQSLGFAMEQKLVLPVKSNLSHLRRDYEAIKRDFLGYPGISAATVSSCVPGEISESGYYLTTREANFKGAPRLLVNATDPDFVSAYGLKVIAGRFFEKGNRGDINEAFVINRTGVKLLGLGTPENAVGKRYQTHYSRRWKTIIGVVEDFHYRGMRELVRPLLFDIEPSLMDTITLSVKPGDMNSTLKHVRTVWGAHFPGVPFESSFLDESFDRLYRYETQMGRLLALTTALGLMIACLGLFGLAYFVIHMRRKEIGIRRVLGASSTDVVLLLSRKFAGLVILSAVLGGPLAGWAMSRWLRDFAYRVELGGAVFAAAAAGALLLAMVTVGFQGWKAARENPAESIRNE